MGSQGGGGPPPAIYTPPLPPAPLPPPSLRPVSQKSFLFSSLAFRIRWEPGIGQEDDGCLRRQLWGTRRVRKPRSPPFLYVSS